MRSKVFSTCGTADCIPKDIRVNPPSASVSIYFSSAVSGFAYVVISAPGLNPHKLRISCKIRTKSRALRTVGVPPPKKTDCALGSKIP